MSSRSSFSQSFFQESGHEEDYQDEDAAIAAAAAAISGELNFSHDNDSADKKNDNYHPSRLRLASDGSVDMNSSQSPPRLPAIRHRASSGEAFRGTAMSRRRSRRPLTRESVDGWRRCDVSRISISPTPSTSRRVQDQVTVDAATLTTPAIDDTNGITTKLEQSISIPRPNRMSTRQVSWYHDALVQSGGFNEDLKAIFGDEGIPDDIAREVLGIDVDPGDTFHNSTSATTTAASLERQHEPPIVDDDEVLEQYKIMAQVEAYVRVKENTGFDVDEYEQRRKLCPEPAKGGEYYSGREKPKPRLPSQKRIVSNSRANDSMHSFEHYQPQEPSILPPRWLNPPSSMFRHVPELCPGVELRGNSVSTTIPPGEHAVRCLGCQTKLRVNLLAMLVQCPDCQTVSPASSTRR